MPKNTQKYNLDNIELDAYKKEMISFGVHNALLTFPLSNDKALKKLSQSIVDIGQLETIKLLDGKILDGRSRFIACKFANIEAKYEHITTADAWQYCLSLNSNCKNLSQPQKSLVAARFYKERKCNQDKIAKQMSISVRSLNYALSTLENASDEVIALVENDKLAISKASILSKLPKVDQKRLALLPASAIKDSAYDKEAFLLAAVMSYVTEDSFPPSNMNEVLPEYLKPIKRKITKNYNMVDASGMSQAERDDLQEWEQSKNKKYIV